MEKKLDTFLLKILDQDNIVNFDDFKKIDKYVYAVPDQDEFIVKTHRPFLEQLINAKQEEHSLILDRAKRFMEMQNRNGHILRKCFGPEYCLYEKFYLQRIKISFMGTQYTFCTLISIRQSSNMFLCPSKIWLGSFYVERRFLDNVTKYESMNSALLGFADFQEKDFLFFMKKL